MLTLLLLIAGTMYKAAAWSSRQLRATSRTSPRSRAPPRRRPPTAATTAAAATATAAARVTLAQLRGDLREVYSRSVLLLQCALACVGVAVGGAARCDQRDMVALALGALGAGVGTHVAFPSLPRPSATSAAGAVLALGVMVVVAHELDASSRRKYLQLRHVALGQVQLRKTLAEAHAEHLDHERRAVEKVLEEQLEAQRLARRHSQREAAQLQRAGGGGGGGGGTRAAAGRRTTTSTSSTRRALARERALVTTTREGGLRGRVLAIANIPLAELRLGEFIASGSSSE